MTDAPSLCTFTLLSTHSDGPLQIGITTNGNGCKLASRIRREIAATLPPNFGSAVERLGAVRRRIWEEDHRATDMDLENEDDDSTAQKSTFNQLVSETDHNAAKTRRMRWLSQICEYWPLNRLTSITDSDIDTILQSYVLTNLPSPQDTTILDQHASAKPEIILAGSGPGSPFLLTLATHRAIQTASIILADKLVPSPVLDLIPRRTPVHIARKFPGNADAAQAELLSLGLDALQRGLTVLRLKQGDPYIYGRGAEEYAFFEERGFTPIVLPGITSALSAPLFAAIPPTHRSVADQVLICTGTGRKGAAPTPPPFVPTQTVIFLMSLHRLPSLVDSLTNTTTSQSPPSPNNTPVPTSTPPWPPSMPCAVLERASCPDQRVIRSSLAHICAAVEQEGSRPPGLLVVGQSCEVLRRAHHTRSARDESPDSSAREAKWVVEDGFVGFGAVEVESGALRMVGLDIDGGDAYVGRGGMEGD